MAKLIVGLGNPGRQYEATRHNAGFIAIDQLITNFQINNTKEDFKALLYFSQIGQEKVIFVKPQTYMNLSGDSLIMIMSFYKIKVEDIIIVYDDKDLPIGKLRFRDQGGAGGHNGIKSIIQVLGTQNFKRVRIGIDQPPVNFKIVDWVLNKMSASEIQTIKENIQSCYGFINDFAQEQDFLNIMNKYNK